MAADSSGLKAGLRQGNVRPLWADQYPEIDRGPIPIAYLHEQKYYDLEREKIFRKSWLYAGRVEEIPSPYGFIVKEYPICNASVLIVKDDATGKLSAFHNLCKHRLNKLVYESSGSVGSFVCNYHAWAYDRAGHLRHVPDESAFYGLDKSKCGLTPVAIAEWRGFIFINLDPKPAETLLEYLEEIPEMVKDYPFEAMAGTYVGLQRELDVNWKVGQQTNMESYHGEKLHISPMLRGAEMIDPANPGNRPINLKLMKRHRFFAFGSEGESVLFKTAPPTVMQAIGLAMAAGGAGEMPHMGSGVPGTNFNNVKGWVGDNYFIFPNLLINTNAGFFQTLMFEPLAVKRTRFSNNFYYPKVRNIAELFAIRVAVAAQINVVLGDMWAGDRVQDGLATGAATEMQLNDSELCIRHEYSVYKNIVEA